MFGLPDQIELWLPGTMLVFVRLSALLLTLPIFGFMTVSPRIRMALAFSFTMLIAPSIVKEFDVQYASKALLLVDILREVMIGLIIGFGSRIVFEAFNLAGGFVSFQMGLAMMNMMDPNAGNNSPVIGNFWSMVIIIFFLVTNSHYFLVETIFINFKSIPLTYAGFDPSAGQVLVKGGSIIYELALKFAAPMIVLMLLSDVALAFAARVMPQMNIFFIGLPLKLGVGIFMLLVSLKIFQTMFGFIYITFEEYVMDVMAGVKGA